MTWLLNEYRYDVYNMDIPVQLLLNHAGIYQTSETRHVYEQKKAPIEKIEEAARLPWRMSISAVPLIIRLSISALSPTKAAFKPSDFK